LVADAVQENHPQMKDWILALLKMTWLSVLLKSVELCWLLPTEMWALRDPKADSFLAKKSLVE